jgi:hypothetical protein
VRGVRAKKKKVGAMIQDSWAKEVLKCVNDFFGKIIIIIIINEVGQGQLDEEYVGNSR